MIDTHCHLDFEAFDADREAVLEAARIAGVDGIVIPGTTAPTWERTLKLARDKTGLHAALGLHPYFILEHSKSHLVELQQQLAAHPEIIAVGEIGLDFTLQDADRTDQVLFFEQQLEIAARFQLPVILHVRKAHDSVIKLLQKTGIQGGTVHAFNGSIQQADAYIEMGFCLGFGGMLTYPHSSKLHRLARELPRESLVLETDAPDMTGHTHHGQRNSPAYLPEVRDQFALIRQETADDIEAYTTENARRVFNLPGIGAGLTESIT